MNRLSGSVLIALLAAGCGSTSSSPGSTVTKGLRYNASADFESSASASLSTLLQSVTTGACADLGSPPYAMDDPILADSLDCDEDGGIVAHITPSRYKVAFKRITLVPASGGTAIDFLADAGTLGASTLVDFSSEDSSETIVTIDPADLTAGTYTGVETEIYYLEMTFSVGGITRNVRIYLSDDDFDSESSDRAGLGPHHQGDITFIDDDGTELGWVDSTWSDTLASSRGSDQNGAGGTDSETGHPRGFFGNAEFWDQTDLMQGADQDIFLFSLDFDSPITIPDPSLITDLTTVTVTFSTADTFYYEDFSPQGTGFSPGAGGEATAESTEWAPLAPTASVTVTTES